MAPPKQNAVIPVGPIVDVIVFEPTPCTELLFEAASMLVLDSGDGMGALCSEKIARDISPTLYRRQNHFAYQVSFPRP